MLLDNHTHTPLLLHLFTHHSTSYSKKSTKKKERKEKGCTFTEPPVKGSRKSFQDIGELVDKKANPIKKEPRQTGILPRVSTTADVVGSLDTNVSRVSLSLCWLTTQTVNADLEESHVSRIITYPVI